MNCALSKLECKICPFNKQCLIYMELLLIRGDIIDTPVMTRCMKITQERMIDERNGVFEICAKYTGYYRVIEVNGIRYRLDLCKEHGKELKVNGQQERESQTG